MCACDVRTRHVALLCGNWEYTRAKDTHNTHHTHMRKTFADAAGLSPLALHWNWHREHDRRYTRFRRIKMFRGKFTNAVVVKLSPSSSPNIHPHNAPLFAHVFYLRANSARRMRACRGTHRFEYRVNDERVMYSHSRVYIVVSIRINTFLK